MTLRLSKFGERFTRSTGAAELMEDLGLVMAGERDALLLGGGNPGRIPAVQALFQKRLADIAASADSTDRMLGKYAHPKGEIGFRKSLASLLKREYGWPVTLDNISTRSGRRPIKAPNKFLVP